MREDWIRELQDELRAFAEARDWGGYHTPRNLAALIASEAGELLALFRWGQDSVRERTEDVTHEVADVFLAVLRFADVAGIDLEIAGREKLEINERNYPEGRVGFPDKRQPKVNDVVQAYAVTDAGSVAKAPRNYVIREVSEKRSRGIEFWFWNDERGCAYSDKVRELKEIKQFRSGRPPLEGKHREDQPPDCFVT